jgi:hypothetical protein
MNDLTLKLVLGAAAVAWLAACILLNKAFRGTAWLAGPTVASCLALLGVAVTSSLTLHGALFLAPVWLAILILSTLHLRDARAAVSARESAGNSPFTFGGVAPPPANPNENDPHI